MIGHEQVLDEEENINLGKDAYKMMLAEGLTVKDLAQFYNLPQRHIVACIRNANPSAVVRY